MSTPVLTYYSYHSGNDDQPYSGEICYNPVLDEIWMNYTIFNPGDNLIRIGNGTSTGSIVGQSILLATGQSYVGMPGIYDSVTVAIIYFTTSGGNKILSTNATTAVVTPVATTGYYTANYNTYASGAAKYYAFPTTNLTVAKVNLATGAFTTVIVAPPGGESFIAPSIAFSSATVGWMLGQFVDPSKLYEYNLTTGAVSNTYTIPGMPAGKGGQWVAYCPVNNSIYIAVFTALNVAKTLVRFNIGTTTFSTVWTAPDSTHDFWFNSTDAAPILNYDSYRNLIWFDDSPGSGSFGSGGSVVAFDPATDTQKYRFDNVFTATGSKAPWKYVIAPDSIWVSENNLSSFEQLLRISFTDVVLIEQPRIFVTLP